MDLSEMQFWDQLIEFGSKPKRDFKDLCKFRSFDSGIRLMWVYFVGTDVVIFMVRYNIVISLMMQYPNNVYYDTTCLSRT